MIWAIFLGIIIILGIASYLWSIYENRKFDRGKFIIEKSISRHRQKEEKRKHARKRG